jgi:hypothetical protein
MTGVFLAGFSIAWQRKTMKWLLVSAALAGLATGTKYQGLILFVPVIILFAFMLRENQWPWSTAVRKGMLAAGGLFGTFAITTPDAIVQPRQLVHDLKIDSGKYYHSGGVYHGATPYDIHSHVKLFGLLLKYVAVALPSHYPIVSYVVVGLAIVGVYALAQRDIWFVVALLAPFILLVLYFSAFQIFIVRNFLLLLPFVALFGGAGFGYLLRILPTLPIRILIMGGAATMFVINATWLFNAAESISHQGKNYDAHVAAAYITAHPDQTFALSKTVLAALREYHVRIPINVAPPEGASQLVFFDSDTEKPDVHLRDWPSTEPNTYVTLGPEEVNFNYYTTWIGADRIIVLSKPRAAMFGLNARVLHLVSAYSR